MKKYFICAGSNLDQAYPVTRGFKNLKKATELFGKESRGVKPGEWFDLMILSSEDGKKFDYLSDQEYMIFTETS